jgi:hypothetical protein
MEGEGGGNESNRTAVRPSRTNMSEIDNATLLELIRAFSNMIHPTVSHATVIAENFILYIRNPNWIPPDYKVAMSPLSQSDWSKMLIYD